MTQVRLKKAARRRSSNSPGSGFLHILPICRGAFQPGEIGSGVFERGSQQGVTGAVHLSMVVKRER